MGRTICICGFVPAEDYHKCWYEDKVDEYESACESGNEELAQKLNAELESAHDRYCTPVGFD